MTLPDAASALPGRESKMPVNNTHFVLRTPLQPPFPTETKTILLGMGCFWGAERKFWTLSGVYTTAVGYCAGTTPNPVYEEVCSGLTGHNEVVLVAYNPLEISLDAILKHFWEAHDPTQGMRQGNDRGTQYRSGIYCFTADQRALAEASKGIYQEALTASARGQITTEILPAGEFYYAEEYHQQYLAKNPGGYCGLGGTGVQLDLKGKTDNVCDSDIE